MITKYWQRGETLDYTPATAVKNGDIVSLNTRVGVAGNDIAAGETGTIHVVGVFEMPKSAGAITLGAAVFWDATAKAITGTAASNIPAGYAVAAAAAADTTVLVKLLG
ncbi:MAG: DUF2190 family protein [Oscillospiraceae bacterium]